TPKFLSENRRYWVVIAAVAAAVITPTPDALTMLVMMVPLLLLYEMGIILAKLVGKRSRGTPESADAATTALMVLLLSGLAFTPARAQGPPGLPPLPSGFQDSTRA